MRTCNASACAIQYVYVCLRTLHSGSDSELAFDFVVTLIFCVGVQMQLQVPQMLFYGQSERHNFRIATSF